MTNQVISLDRGWTGDGQGKVMKFGMSENVVCVEVQIKSRQGKKKKSNAIETLIMNFSNFLQASLFTPTTAVTVMLSNHTILLHSGQRQLFLAHCAECIMKAPAEMGCRQLSHILALGSDEATAMPEAGGNQFTRIKEYVSEKLVYTWMVLMLTIEQANPSLKEPCSPELTF
jgi:hypothetical protein